EVRSKPDFYPILLLVREQDDVNQTFFYFLSESTSFPLLMIPCTFPFICRPRKAEFFDFDIMFSFLKTHSVDGVNNVRLATDFAAISESAIPKILLPAVSLSIITSNGKTVIKAPKADSSPIVPFFANANSIFLFSMSIGL